MFGKSHFHIYIGKAPKVNKDEIRIDSFSKYCHTSGRSCGKDLPLHFAMIAATLMASVVLFCENSQRGDSGTSLFLKKQEQIYIGFGNYIEATIKINEANMRQTIHCIHTSGMR